FKETIYSPSQEKARFQQKPPTTKIILLFSHSTDINFQTSFMLNHIDLKPYQDETTTNRSVN
ncbi:hypothetical protein, partial [Pseudomonas sp. MPR-R2A4]|uniref:hypothetical protein n=1 Tax=Pseudomonas sp. MPR-R2A4 TaxID=2070620 RepID=UPI001A90E552